MSAKRRIIHLIGTLESGGAEHMLLRTLPLLNDDEFEQIVVTLFRPGRLTAVFVAKGIRVVDVGGMGRLVPTLRALDPSLIITYLLHADMIGRLFVQPNMAVPVVASLGTTYNFPRYLPARVAERMTKHIARHYIANSQAVKEYYVHRLGVDEDRITVVPNGIDPAVFDKADPSPILEELMLPGQRFVVTCVANLARNKGHRFLLEAFEQLSKQHDDCRLLLVGSGQEEQALCEQRNQYRSKDRIILLGRRDDVPAILAATDVFVLPTLFEGMSNAIQEAMAARLPVITTDIPENRVLIVNEESGLLTPTKDSESIYRALERLYDDRALREVLGGAARGVIDRSFQMPVVLRSWQQMLRRQAMA